MMKLGAKDRNPGLVYRRLAAQTQHGDSFSLSQEASTSRSRMSAETRPDISSESTDSSSSRPNTAQEIHSDDDSQSEDVSASCCLRRSSSRARLMSFPHQRLSCGVTEATRQHMWLVILTIACLIGVVGRRMIRLTQRKFDQKNHSQMSPLPVPESAAIPINNGKWKAILILSLSVSLCALSIAAAIFLNFPREPGPDADNKSERISKTEVVDSPLALPSTRHPMCPKDHSVAISTRRIPALARAVAMTEVVDLSPDLPSTRHPVCRKHYNATSALAEEGLSQAALNLSSPKRHSDVAHFTAHSNMFGNAALLLGAFSTLATLVALGLFCGIVRGLLRYRSLSTGEMAPVDEDDDSDRPPGDPPLVIYTPDVPQTEDVWQGTDLEKKVFEEVQAKEILEVDVKEDGTQSDVVDIGPEPEEAGDLQGDDGGASGSNIEPGPEEAGDLQGDDGGASGSDIGPEAAEEEEHEESLPRILPEDHVEGTDPSGRCQYLSPIGGEAFLQELVDYGVAAVHRYKSKLGLQAELDRFGVKFHRCNSEYFLKYTISYIGESIWAGSAASTDWEKALQRSRTVRKAQRTLTVGKGRLRATVYY